MERYHTRDDLSAVVLRKGEEIRALFVVSVLLANKLVYAGGCSAP